ncbi:MAG: Sec-independent protein translocase subunit TatB [Pantoea sp.]|uniref:Sec-independent protein translocase protein TatB n=1 Tax=Pantoea brenneri TaxID=472694 RepID=A0AAX3J0U4_9GAMM|nr:MULTISPECIES: Sec-independent protein translocase protein TatB [Pantoea]MBS6034702.1 Sec-independent protein translocase subunit TatB [Pantoea sp.]MDH2122552.1 Sec-independent protein translocase protein TatB [Pantoea brenneri]VXB08574.1 TatABCE protein translocation system subunit [Pantoea brenneri]
MFDIGFSELVLVFVIGLIVLGPQRLPVAVKTVVGWIRAIRSLAANVQNELAQELKLQELQDSLKKVEEAGRGTLSPELKESMEELRKTADSMKRSVSQSIDIEKEEDEANTIHSPQHRSAPPLADQPEVHPAAAGTASPSGTPAAADHQASAPVQAPSVETASAGQPAATVASAPAQAPARADTALASKPDAATTRTSASPSSASDER